MTNETTTKTNETVNLFPGWTLDALRERARLNGLRGIRVSPELRAEILRREQEAA